MEKRMLINAVDKEQCRIAIIEGKTLAELEIESDPEKKLKGNVYKAKIVRIEPSLQAAFIDLGTDRNGFIQINDIHPAYFAEGTSERHGRVFIQDALSVGQELIVQVVKEEREMKGATLTTYLSLPGRYLVLMPGSDRGGVSRKISDSDQRSRLRNLGKDLEIPTGMGIIIRTAGLDRSQSELARDLTLQLKLWEEVVKAAHKSPSPALIYKENDSVTRVIRDYFTPDIREILIDRHSTYIRAREFVETTMPRYRSRVVFYDGKEPLFSKFGIEVHVSSTLEPTVSLKSGGSIVLEQLEALVAIDVNSGKATAGLGIEETAYRTNLEAADEIGRQLRLRDLGGLIIIDFIDMTSRKHQAEVERRIRSAVKLDKARIEVGRLSKFGLVEMSRQRIRASLASQSHHPCQHCHGHGQVKNPNIIALDALRKIQAAVIVGHVSVVKLRLSHGPAFFLLNQKKNELVRLEEEYKVKIYVLGDPRLRVDEFEFEMETKPGAPKQEALVSGPPKPEVSTETEEEDQENEDSQEGSAGRPKPKRPKFNLKKIKELKSKESEAVEKKA